MKMQISPPRGLRGYCRLLGYSPQAYYQHQKTAGRKSLAEDLIIHQVLFHRIFQPRIGCRKLHEMMVPFMESHDMYICRDVLFDLLRDNGLLINKRKRSQPQTTDSNHWMRKYPDLIKDVRLSRADELWVSDITYIRLNKKNFAYLSLVTDAYSRKIVGYCLNHDLSAAGPIQALEMALKGRTGDGPLIHHSDRGSQYCGDGYITLLKANGINISMTQSGDPRDNAIAERVNGILKQELLEHTYRNIKKAQCSVDIAIDVYNRIRPHSSVDMMTPEKAHVQTGPITRRWKSPFTPARQTV
jgi:transposase InsO family protein